MNKKLNNTEIKEVQYLIGFSDGLAGSLAMLSVLLEKVEKYKDNKKFKPILIDILSFAKALTDVLEKSTEELDNMTKKIAEKYEIEYDEEKEVIAINLETNEIEIEEKIEVPN